jgi:prolyl-tRNA synthetase
VLVPIYRKDEERTQVLETARKLATDLKISVDDREGQTPGAKFFYWERRGVPVVLELGPRDLANGTVVLKRRDTGLKQPAKMTEVATALENALDSMQQDLYNLAKQRLQENSVTADSLQEVEDILRDVTAERGGGKFVYAYLKDDPACDARLKEFKATVRCLPLADGHNGGRCIVTGEPVDQRVVIAKAY